MKEIMYLIIIKNHDVDIQVTFRLNTEISTRVKDQLKTIAV